MCPPAAPAWGAEVELELATAEGLPLAGHRAWHERLTELGVDRLRLRPARPGDRVDVRTEGDEPRQTIQIQGWISAAGQLAVPYHKFEVGQTAALRRWLEGLRAGDIGPPQAQGPPDRFGLSAESATRLNAALAETIAPTTLGRGRWEVFGELRTAAKLPIVVAPNAQVVPGGPGEELDVLADELGGLTVGTALAVLLRPAELGWRPSERDGALTLLVERRAPGVAQWPIGHPARGSGKGDVPQYFAFSRVGLGPASVEAAAREIETDLKLAVRLDRWALARHSIDPSTTEVTFALRHTAYSTAVRQLLGPAKLQAKLLRDEADHYFLWITTLRNP